jgi:beta-glucosidase
LCRLQSPFRAYTQQAIDQAAALASESDVAIVVVAQPAGEDFGDLSSLSLANPSDKPRIDVVEAKRRPLCRSLAACEP